MGTSTGVIRNTARALIVRDGAILLQVCRFDGEVVHVLPGGTQERGESLADTVRREVLEETGLSVRVDGLVWVREFITRHHLPLADDDDHVVDCIFRCTPEIEAAAGPVVLPDASQIGIRWVPLEEVADLTMWPHTVQHLLAAWDAESIPLMPSYLGDCA